jgi:hypothetical protein
LPPALRDRLSWWTTWAAPANELMARFCALTLPPAADASVVIAPLSFGAQLPPLA